MRSTNPLTAPSRPAATRPRPVVLVVDDDREMRDYLRRCLKPLEDRLGTILEAADGQAAFELAISEQVDLVITDVVMPRLDGLALLRRLGARRSPPKVLVVSGEPGPEQARAAGVESWLARPFDRRTLCRQVSIFLDSREDGRKREEQQGE